MLTERGEQAVGTAFPPADPDPEPQPEWFLARENVPGRAGRVAGLRALGGRVQIRPDGSKRAITLRAEEFERRYRPER